MHIRDDVLTELDFDPAIDTSSIDVTVDAGVVSIFGHVERYAEKVMAERVARRIRHVRAVVLDLEIRPPGLLDKVSDSELASRASSILKWATSAGYRLTIAVRKGHVNITGIVDSYHQKLEARRALRGMLGVTAITDSTTVRRRPIAADASERIAGAIRRNAEFACETIRVDVSGSTVALDGEVSTWRAHTLAEHTAWSLPGVTAVDNRLVVS